MSCFLLPRWLPEEGRNAIRLLRLKDKLGNRANASAEVELDGAWAHLLGGDGDGVRTILAMVHHTRLDTAMAPAGLMRAALREAHRWCEGRTAFGARLIDQPLMRAVLADLPLDWEGALALDLRVAQAFDQGERPFARVAVALAKFLASKRCVAVTAEAMEAMGGMGYVEETPMPILYREAPLNGIREGSGNVICLDILRTLARDAASREALEAEWETARGLDQRYDAALGPPPRPLGRPPGGGRGAAPRRRGGAAADRLGPVARGAAGGGRGLCPGPARPGPGPRGRRRARPSGRGAPCPRGRE